MVADGAGCIRSRISTRLARERARGLFKGLARPCAWNLLFLSFPCASCVGISEAWSFDRARHHYWQASQASGFSSEQDTASTAV